ncbi:MAG: hypothetical protein APF76_04535 [Desulfitibacter sp. BRH_c19]|nr:MAG: hypothetical protein APF76_04535 [Desulfitibacter sp. BRH_c19]
MDAKERLQEIIGCQIRTHYDTGGIVTGIYGPRGDFYTLNYEDQRGHRCIINTIQVKNEVIICEGKHLHILERARPVQTQLFGLPGIIINE